MTIVLFGGAAHAADTSEGSKNFAVPASVPNYFSNEAGPLQGPASETRRGPLYPAGTAAEVPQAAPRAVASVPSHGRQHIAMAMPRSRVFRGRVAYERRGRVVAERHTVTRGRSIYHAVAHGRGRVERVVAHSRAVFHRPIRTSAVHRRARG